jgi:hypothetical protein
VERKNLTALERQLAGRLIMLAEDALAAGELAESERLYREVLHFIQLILEPNHPEVAKTLYKLAFILEFQDKYSESIELVERARAIMRQQVESVSFSAEAMMAPFVAERTS